MSQSLLFWLLVGAMAGIGWVMMLNRERAEREEEQADHEAWLASQAEDVERAHRSAEGERATPPPMEPPELTANPVVEHPTFAVAGGGQFAENCRAVDYRQSVELIADSSKPGQWRVLAEGVGQIGFITARHPVAKALAAGDEVLHASVNSFDLAKPEVRVRIVTGERGGTYSMHGPKTYPVSLVGEQFCQGAIAGLRVGDSVDVVHEPDNPYDDLALSVRTMGDATIGYLPRDSFLRELVFDEDRSCRATVMAIEEDRLGRGFRQVTLSVEKVPGPIEVREYRAA